MRLRFFSTLLMMTLFALGVTAQTLTQTVRGRVIDTDSKVPAIGATVIIVGAEPFKGASTDLDGYFKLEDVPVGRITLAISYVGYEKQVLSNILVGSAKEVVLNVEITENINQLKAVEIVGNSKHDEPINEMAIISSRKFSTEEASRYAGSFNDPARMASNFAGVSNGGEGNNDIIVRGNSPKGILWRLEGIEIPNPNHFADEGSTGGPINALNSKMLSNSEFLTGAFAPEYGNATSGVLDLKLRKGNNEKREYALGVGVLGMDATVEGPFKKGGKASYLANYRYSSLALLNDAGIVDFGGVPKYQDGAFNIDLPTKKAGQFSVFGLGGISHIIDEVTDTSDENYVLERADYEAHFGVMGLKHFYIINKKMYVKSSLSMANNGSSITQEERRVGEPMKVVDQGSMDKNAAKIASTVNWKLNAKNTFSGGLIYTQLFYQFKLKELDDNGQLVIPLSVNETAGYSQAHATWKHRFNDQLTMVTGAHFLQFNMNNTYSIEPRIGLSYKLTDKQTLTAGFGVHSRMESLLFYTANVTQPNGSIIQPNLDLEIPKANHYVLGYDFHFTPNTHVKAELYYQDLYDVPIENKRGSSYSLINSAVWFDNVALVSQGRGRNYGLEVTLERYFAKKFYYLVTASLYDAEFKNFDNEWRRSRFAGNYNANFLIGKEFEIGKGKNKALLTNVKTTLIGGQRYTPVDLAASIAAGEQVRSSEPLSFKGEDIFFMNVSCTYRVNRKKTSHEFKLEILNATNNKAKSRDYYNADTQKIEYNRQLSIIPNFMYTLNF